MPATDDQHSAPASGTTGYGAPTNRLTADRGVTIDSLTLRAGDKMLLDNVTARFHSGKITLIVGPSGAGKSLLLRIIAGLIKTIDGEIKVQGKVCIGDRAVKAGLAGVVFQQFALFDELSSRSNVDFARAHRPRVHADANASEDKKLLDQLRVPTNVRTSQLSGGQRQRLAIARALAYHPEAILYDEPTSGLDWGTARKVAEMIRDTQTQFGTTSVIVTHDYESLLSIADEVYFLNPDDASLRLVPPAEWADLPKQLDEIAQTISHNNEERPLSLARQAQSNLARFFESTSRIAEETIKLPLRVIPNWKSFRWGSRYFLHYLRLVAGPTAWIYLFIAGIIIGFVTTYFVFKFLPFASYTEPLLIEDLLLAMGFSLYRIFIPVIATVLVAARCGAAVASDVGSKQYGQQIDAMRTFGANPRTYLLNNIMLAFLIGMPLLNWIAFQAARYTSLLAFTFTHLEHGPSYWHLYFHRKLVSQESFFYEGAWWLLAKLLTCAVGIALISYHRGASPKYSSNDVSRSVTSTILWSTLYVLVVHFVYAFLEF